MAIEQQKQEAQEYLERPESRERVMEIGSKADVVVGAFLDESKKMLPTLTKYEIAELEKIDDAVREAGREVARIVADTPENTQEKLETVTQVFEYKDKDGKSLGRVSIERGAKQRPAAGWEYAGHELSSIIYEVGTDEGPKNIDLLDLLDVPGVRVFMQGEKDEADSKYNYFYRNDAWVDGEATKLVFVPPLDNPAALSTFLHEMGHAQQDQEDRYHRLSEVAVDDYPLEYQGYHLDQVRKQFPEFEEMLPDEFKGQVDSLLDDHERLKFQLELSEIKQREVEASLAPLRTEVNTLREDIKSFDFQDHDDPQLALQELKDRYSITRDKLVARVISEESPALEARSKIGRQLTELRAQYKELMKVVDEIIRLPRRLTEFDATRRAFQWLKKIKKQTGIDLSRSVVEIPAHKVSEQQLTTKPGHGRQKYIDAVRGNPDETVETSAFDELIGALETYQALKFRRPPKVED
jgi:hypothetical protein